MKFTEDFLKIKSSKDLKSMLIRNNENGCTVQLSLEEKSKYNDETKMVYLTFPCEISTVDYLNGGTKTPVSLCFHNPVYIWLNDPVKTFLKYITKKSDVKFKVLLNNSTESITDAGLVAHDLIGEIDSKAFLLQHFVGKYNSACPVQY